MADISAKDVHNMKDDQLLEHIKTARQDLFNLRFRNATGELENTAGLSKSKRALARALTVAGIRNIDVERELHRG